MHGGERAPRTGLHRPVGWRLQGVGRLGYLRPGMLYEGQENEQGIGRGKERRGRVWERIEVWSSSPAWFTRVQVPPLKRTARSPSPHPGTSLGTIQEKSQNVSPTHHLILPICR